MESQSNLKLLLCSQSKYQVPGTESQTHSYQKRLQRLFILNSCSKQEQLQGHTRFLRSNPILRTSKDKDIIMSLGDLLHCLYGKKGLPYIKSELLLFFSLCPLYFVLSLSNTMKSFALSSSRHPCKFWNLHSS